MTGLKNQNQLWQPFIIFLQLKDFDNLISVSKIAAIPLILAFYKKIINLTTKINLYPFR
jgi:hypothetical protein